jgi:hypothetical protein
MCADSIWEVGSGRVSETSLLFSGLAGKSSLVWFSLSIRQSLTWKTFPYTDNIQLQTLEWTHIHLSLKRCKSYKYACINLCSVLSRWRSKTGTASMYEKNSVQMHSLTTAKEKLLLASTTVHSLPNQAHNCPSNHQPLLNLYKGTLIWDIFVNQGLTKVTCSRRWG